MLQQGSELITMTGEELSGGDGGTTAVLATVSSDGDNTSHQIVTDAPQIIKSSLGQFVVLQQNQVSAKVLYVVHLFSFKLLFFNDPWKIPR